MFIIRSYKYYKRIPLYKKMKNRSEEKNIHTEYKILDYHDFEAFHTGVYAFVYHFITS